MSNERLLELLVKKETKDKVIKLKQGKTYDQFINELLKEKEGNPAKNSPSIPRNPLKINEVLDE